MITGPRSSQDNLLQGDKDQYDEYAHQTDLEKTRTSAFRFKAAD